MLVGCLSVQPVVSQCQSLPGEPGAGCPWEAGVGQPSPEVLLLEDSALCRVDEWV